VELILANEETGGTVLFSVNETYRGDVCHLLDTSGVTREVDFRGRMNGQGKGCFRRDLLRIPYIAYFRYHLLERRKFAQRPLISTAGGRIIGNDATVALTACSEQFVMPEFLADKRHKGMDEL